METIVGSHDTGGGEGGHAETGGLQEVAALHGWILAHGANECALARTGACTTSGTIALEAILGRCWARASNPLCGLLGRRWVRPPLASANIINRSWLMSVNEPGWKKRDETAAIRDLMRAASFAAQRHCHQRRKGQSAEPYVNH